jgi:hypothetical protein
MAKLSPNLTAISRDDPTLHPRENLYKTAQNLAALNAEVVIDCDGSTTVSLDLRGTFNMTVEVAGTIDGTNWILIPVRSMLGGQYLIAVVGSTAGAWIANCAGFRKVRARCTAYTSGAAITTLMASTSLLDETLGGDVAPLLVTTTGASGAAVTLTLPAPGAGLRQYLSYLRITRFAASVLTASGTPVLITTTNVPGTLVFTAPADAAAQGVTTPIVAEDFAKPLMGSAQNTNMTFVMPATTGVIWRATAAYQVKP